PAPRALLRPRRAHHRLQPGRRRAHQAPAVGGSRRRQPADPHRPRGPRAALRTAHHRELRGSGAGAPRAARPPLSRLTTPPPNLAPAVLDVLRRHTGNPELQYAEPPVRVSGGFWADILAVRLEGAPPELDRDLIVRVMPADDAAHREIVVHTQVAAQGFPAPAVRLTGDATDGLGRPFIVMDRAPGHPLMPE